YCPITDNYWDTSGIRFNGSLSDSLSVLKDTLGNIALLSLHHTGNMGNIRIHPGVIQATAICIPPAGWYRQGDSLLFTLIYSEPAFLQNNSSNPSIDFMTNGALNKALYQSGSGSREWHFLYRIPAGLFAPDGISLIASVHQSKNSIRDKWGNPAPTQIMQMPDARQLKIDAIVPMIDHTDLPQNGVYGLGRQILATLHFSEPVFLRSAADSVYLLITIGTVPRKMFCIDGKGTDTWQFAYTIQPGDLDKDGIRFSGNLYAVSSLPVDLAANPVNPSLHLPASTAGILVDGYGPSFLQAANDTLRYCADTGPIFLNDIFGISDEEAGELVSWRISKAPRNGTIARTSFSKSNDSSQLLPEGWQYQPEPGWTGIDSLETEVTDGANTIRKKILIQINPPIGENRISGDQVICSGTRPTYITGTRPVGGYANYRYTWEISQLNATEGYSICMDSAGLESISLQTVIRDTWIRRRIYSGNCQQLSDPVFIHTRQEGIWLGQSPDWLDTANWCGHGIPGVETDVILRHPVSYTPLIKEGAFCRNLWMQDTQQLDITGTLQISGDIHAGQASIHAQNGTIFLKGKQAQSLSGKWFTNHTLASLIVENPQGVILYDTVLLEHSLKMQAGTITTNNSLYLLPDAYIAPAAKQTGLAGKLTLFYRFANNQTPYYLLQHPFLEDIDWKDISRQVILTGPGGIANGFHEIPGNPVSIWQYDNRSGNDSAGLEAGWQTINTITSDSSANWKSNQPIRLLFQGIQDSLPLHPPYHAQYGSCLTWTGHIPTGDMEKTIPQGRGGRYIVAGNPYAAPIDPAQISRTNNISRYYWRWLPGQGKHGGYTAYPFENSQSVKPWETMLVQVLTEDPASLSFSEEAKTEKLNTSNIETAPPYHGYYIEMQIWQDSSCFDRLLILGMDSARAGIDPNDAPKIKNPDLDFYSLSREGYRLSADARSLTSTTSIPIGIRSEETGHFRLFFADAYLPPSNPLQLHDIYNNRWIPIIKGSSYDFSISNDSSSQGDQRFELHVPVTVTTRQLNKESIRMQLNPVPARTYVQITYSAKESGNCELRITDATGKIWQVHALGQQKEGNLCIDLTNLAPGIYYVQLCIGELMAAAGFIRQ
ncbi:MAG TPA: T9SS type A sorting domain-containing protein, partial [Sediminibacterium sp.]|nr:T9SS type A sorting domain-containing protein [Sediminibacterium sp.]